MDFGMPFLIETENLLQCAALCKKLGLQFIEWNMNFPQCQPECLRAEQLNEIKEREGLYFTIHLDENFNICDFNERVRKAYMETAVEAIRLAKQIKAPIINMHLAKGIYITLPDKKRFLFEEYQDAYYKNILEFREACEREVGGSGIKIAVENTEGFREYEQKAVELLLDSGCFGLTLDIGHSHTVKDIDIPFYEKHMNKLIHMHAHDARGTKNHLAFGDGEIDLKQRLSLAENSGSRVVLETKTVEALTRTVEYMKREFSWKMKKQKEGV